MCRIKYGIRKRVLAFFLVVVMMLSLMPETTLTAQAAEGAFTICVKDSVTTNSLAGASVNVKNDSLLIDETKVTDGDGNAVFYVDFGELSALDVAVTVTLNGYETQSDTRTISVSGIENFELIPSMSQKSLTISLNGGTGTVKLNGVNQSLGALGSITVDYDENVSVPIEVTPDQGFYISAINIGGTEQSIPTKGDTYTGSVVMTENITVTVTLCKEYKIHVSVEGDAIVKLNNIEQTNIFADEGTIIPIEVIPGINTYISEIIIGDVTQTIPAKGDGFITDIELTADVEISVRAITECTVALNKSVGGTVAINSNEVESIIVDKDSQVTLEVSADKGYEISKVEIAGVPQIIVDKNTYSNSEILITSDTTINVEFVKIYTVQIQFNEDGTVAIDGSLVAANDNVTIYEADGVVEVVIDPDDNYRVAAVSVDGVEKTDSMLDSNFSTTDMYVLILDTNKDYVVEITFAPNRYEVTKASTVNGSISLGNEIVNHGANCSVTVLPDDVNGYKVNSIKVNGLEITAFDMENSDGSVVFMIENITEPKNVEATFSLKEYGVIAGASENGTISIEATSVIHGGACRVTVTPDDANGYEIGVITVNDVVVTTFDVENANGSVEFVIANIVENQNIEATFTLKEYDITLETVINGTIVSDSQRVQYGSDCVVAVTPSDGYAIGTITVNGTEITTYNDDNEDGTIIFNIENIQENKNVGATFVVKENYVSTVGEILNVSDAIRVDGLKYIYPNNKTAIFTTDKSGIKLYSGNTVIAGGKNNQSVSITQDSNVTSIQLYYRATGQWRKNWHKADCISESAPIKIVFDTVAPQTTLIPDVKHNGDFYIKSFDVIVDSTDSGDYSGIQSIEYFVTDTKIGSETTYEDVTSKKTQWGTLYEYTGLVEECVNDKIHIEVTEEQNNSDYVVVWLKVTDRAGNVEYVRSEEYLVNCTAPVLESVAIDGTLHKEAKEGYYNRERTATIVIKDRASSFDQVEATKGIKITAKKANGDVVVLSPAMISWTHEGDIHTATIEFEAEAKYIWSISYINKAGIGMDKASVVETGDNIYEFTVDKTVPTGTISLPNSEPWKDIIDFLTFGNGRWYKESVTVTSTADDEISAVYPILYYKSDSEVALEDDDLETLYAEEPEKFVSSAYTITEDERFVIYARITDYAGNTVYIGTNGAIVDMTDSIIEFYPEDANEHKFYNNKDGVKIDVSVSEVKEGTTAYAGIKSIDYKVINVTNNDEVTQEGNLYTFDVQNPTYSQLKSEWNSAEEDKSIIVDSEKNNADNIKVVVTVVDNAGNDYSEDISLAINIDEINAEVIVDGEANKVVDGRGYFDVLERKAIIKITDRTSSFDADAATSGIKVSAVDANGEPVENAYTISEWLPDSTGDVHTAVVTFSADANYEWMFTEYTNKADNSLDIEANLSTGDSQTPFTFTVDDTNPVGSISVNTNTWDKLLEFITFGLYDKAIVEVVASSSDATSPFVVEYYKTSEITALTWEELDEKEFAMYSDFSVSANEQFVIYLKITDFAGNYIYINSDGYVVDSIASNIIPKPSIANGKSDSRLEIADIYYAGSEVKVDVRVEDVAPYSGIKTVEYWITNDGVETQRQTMFSFDYTRDEGNNSNGGTLIITDWDSENQKNTESIKKVGKTPTQEELVKVWSGTINVDKLLNNSCNVKLTVKTVDNAGNEKFMSCSLDIDITPPVIDVTFDNNADNNGNTYFKDNDGNEETPVRTAKVVITEREHHFDMQAATEGISIIATDANENIVENAYTISDWEKTEGTGNLDDTKWTATIVFKKDANYRWFISYTDKAGNKNEGINTGDSVAPFDFTIDTVEPIGIIMAESAEGRKDTWTSLVNDLTFGFWSKQEIEITGTADDITSGPIAKIEYYKVKATNAVDGTIALTSSELDNITTWTTVARNQEMNVLYNIERISSDEQFTIYVKITDLAGNYSYVGTNGLIVDQAAPMKELLAPEIIVSPQQQESGIYNNDVRVDIKVVDPLVGGTYSGIKTVSYQVINMGTTTQEGTLYVFNNANPKQDELYQAWSGSVMVDSSLNNSNDVRIVVNAEDNSKNSSSAAVEIKIDVTAPEINISYDNNNSDNESYFKEDRTATIVIKERNFDAEDVVIDITNTDSAIPSISEWVRSGGTGNMDDMTWTTTLTYSSDGDYVFDIAYTDLADNKCEVVQYGNSVAPTEFTIDKTIPMIYVSYNNNSESNDKYFNEKRIAIIEIVEHNFDVDRVVFTQTFDGHSVTNPSATWENSGDIHTATIVYEKDGDYTFDVKVTDMAANESEEADYGDSVAGRDFVVDQTIEKPEIGGVKNGEAYKGDVIPTISFGDTNYESCKVMLLRTRYDEKNVDVTDKYIQFVNEYELGGDGVFDTFDKEKVENDGIYTLSVEIFDKAGNSENTTVTFSINRFGSVYVYSDYLVSLIKDGGQYVSIKNGEKTAITDDLVITEYNADRLLEGKLNILITRDGEPIKDVIYTSTPTDINDKVAIGESGWYQYEYIISKTNFAEDGVYKLALTSSYATSDSKSNESTSIPENSMDGFGNQILDAMKFTVDTTAPEIQNIVNLDKAIVDAQVLDVKYSVVDIGGLSSIEVIVNGNVIQNITEFADSIYDYSGSFPINEQAGAQTVQIRITDIAGNVTDTSTEDFSTKDMYVFNDTVTVSTNFLVRWYANTLLFWGTIGGMTALCGGLVYLIMYRRRKKELVE